MSLTVSLVAVLIPLLFMGGLVGRLFREFAITLAIAIGISAILSLTLTAMMCAWILKPHDEQHAGVRSRAAFERGFAGLGAVLRPHAADRAAPPDARRCSSRSRPLAVTVLLAIHVPKGFFPVEDTGMIVGVTEAAPDVSFPQDDGAPAARRPTSSSTDPDVATVSSFIGADGTNPTHEQRPAARSR